MVDITVPRRWWVVKNERQMPCKTKTRSDGTRHIGCGQVHEYLTHDCRPVAFSNPDEWAFFQKITTQDRSKKWVEREVTMYQHPLGMAVEISDEEARKMDCVFDPMATTTMVAVKREPPRRVTTSFPMGPLRVREN